MDVRRYGPWALIVGGSEGVGRSLAQKLSASGFKLVLVARKPEPLAELAAELSAQGAEVRTVSADMSKPDALDRVRTATDGLEIGLMVYNAGANSVRGAFVELDPEVYRTVIGVNVTNLSEFARHYGGAMRERERGGIITLGSTAGYLGSPSLASYCASKAFVRVLSESMWAEGRQFGVDVLHIVIGLTATPAMARLGYTLSAAEQPDDVAQLALDNVANGPVLITERNVDSVIAAARITDRAEVVGAMASGGRK
jgi:short-subunit dehydrogenase